MLTVLTLPVALVLTAFGLALTPSVAHAAVDPLGTVTVVARATATPTAITAGPDGNLWFRNASGDSIGRITPAGVTTQFAGQDTDGGGGLTAGPDGNVWFTNEHAQAIGRMTPTGDVTVYADPAIKGPTSIAKGGDGNLWFTNTQQSEIGRITPLGAVTSFTDPAIHEPSAITTAANGDLWFGAAGGIGRLVTTGPTSATMTFFALGALVARSLVTAPDGNVWFTTFGDTIGRLTPGTGTVDTFPASDAYPAAATSGIAVGSEGHLWVTDIGVPVDPHEPPYSDPGSVREFDLTGALLATYHGSVDAPVDIASGPDGNLWFTNVSRPNGFFYPTAGLGFVSKITPAGAISSFARTEALDGPTALSAGPDGDVWVVGASNTITRITPTGAMTHTVDPAGVLDLTAGPDGALWFASGYPGATVDTFSIGRITTDGVVTHFARPDIGAPTNIAAGPDGNLWYLDLYSIAAISPAGVSVARYQLGYDAVALQLVTGPDGDLWLRMDDGSVRRISTAGDLSSISGLGGVSSIAAGPDGNVWFTTDTSVGKITPGGVVTAFTDPAVGTPATITMGTDGRMWFLDRGSHTLHRITTSGAVTVVAGPPIGATAMTAGPDGNMWIVDARANRLTKVGTGIHAPGSPGVPTATPGPGRMTVSWAPPPSLLDANVEHYTVTASPGGATCRWVSGPLSCVVPGLAIGTAYTFTVTATNGVGSSAPTAASTAVVSAFTDVPPGVPFFDDITWLFDQGITTGYPDGSFGHALPISRDAMAAFLYRDAGRPLGDHPVCTTAPFTDVATSAPFCGEIAWMKTQGLTTGYPDGSFHPGAPVERQAMAAFLFRAFEPHPTDVPHCTTAPFVDVASSAPFCREIAWMKDQGIATEYLGGSFDPLAPVERQAMAAFLHRLAT